MLKIIPLIDNFPWELEWILTLLAEVPDVELTQYADPIPIEDGALYLFNSNQPVDFSAAFIDGLRKAKGVGLLHTGDEYLRTDLSRYADFSYVIRMYHSKDAVGDGVFTIPVGPTPNLDQPDRTPASARRYTWMFAGDWNADRSSMARSFKTWRNGLLSMPMPYKDHDRISREDYLHGMANEAFALCPAGNIALETCRPYEALHLGCHPDPPEAQGYRRL
jgi:hypothetical protein